MRVAGRRTVPCVQAAGKCTLCLREWHFMRACLLLMLVALHARGHAHCFRGLVAKRPRPGIGDPCSTGSWMTQLSGPLPFRFQAGIWDKNSIGDTFELSLRRVGWR